MENEMKREAKEVDHLIRRGKFYGITYLVLLIVLPFIFSESLIYPELNVPMFALSLVMLGVICFCIHMGLSTSRKLHDIINRWEDEHGEV